MRPRPKGLEPSQIEKLEAGDCGPEVEERIQQIADMMLDGSFVRGHTYKELAAEWGFSEPYTRRLTAAAARRVHTFAKDPEGRAATILSVMETIMFEALADGQDMLALKAASNISMVIGARTKRSKVYDELPLAELEAKAAAAEARLKAENEDEVPEILPSIETTPPPKTDPTPDADLDAILREIHH